LTAAITAAKVTGRPTTILINGTITTAVTIVVDASNITLQGVGGDTTHDIGAGGGQARARIVWVGSAGGTVVQFASPAGASNQICTGGGMQDIYVACGNSAAIGLQVLSWRSGTFQRIHFDNPTTAGLDVNVVASLGEARDPQNNYFSRLSSRHSEVTGGTGGLLRLGGDATANASLNMFDQLDCQFLNGTAYLFNNSDNNYITRFRAFRVPGGAGNAIVFNGNNVSVDQTARGNILVHLTVNGSIPIIGRGTPSFTHPSTNNSVLLIDIDNAYAAPTIEAGSSVIWSDNSGLVVNHRFIGLAAGETTAAANEARARVGSGSVHLTNGSENHVQLSDFANAARWGINLTGAGDLRFVRLAGSGNMNLPATTAFNGGLITLGAVDSGGAGFRALRVPN